MRYTESAFSIACEDEEMLGVLALPEEPAKLGVLVIVGGPQYRVGSHRQFVLLSRSMAEAGIATMRFDYRGMGDSSGEMRSFEDVQSDIQCAVERFVAAVPALQGVVLWGLCDAASAACFYVAKRHDVRIRGLMLLNPWVRTEAGEARTYLRNYYIRRLFSGDFWRKLLGGRLNPITVMHSLLSLVRKASAKTESAHGSGSAAKNVRPLPERVMEGLVGANLPALVLLSGNDFVAAEFETVVAHSAVWERAWMPDQKGRIRVERLVDANHTFSSRLWRQQVEQYCRDWMFDLLKERQT